MKRWLACLIILGLLVGCGPKATETPPADPPAVAEETSEPQAPETPDEPKEPEAPVAKHFITAPEDTYDWPEAADESDFVLNDQGIVTTYNGDGGVVVIPESIGGKPVLGLGNSLFYSNDKLTHLKLPEGLKLVGESAVYMCQNLEAISLPESLEAIDAYAFMGSEKVSSLVIPANVALIGREGFGSFIGLKEITFLGEAPYIDELAFSRINDYAAKVRVGEEAKAAIDDALGISAEADGRVNPATRETASDDFVSQGNVLSEYTGSGVFVEVPDGTTEIADKAFSNLPLLRVVKLPDSVEKIGSEVFFASQPDIVHFGSGLKTIADKAFFGVGLLDLQLPDGVTSLGEEAFFGHNVKVLHLPTGLTEIPRRAFAQGSLSEVYFPKELKKIGEEAFADNGNLNYLVFATDQMPEIDPTAFNGASISDIDIDYEAPKDAVARIKQAWIDYGLAEDSFAVWRADHPDAGPYPSDAEMTFDSKTQLITSYKGVYESMTMFWNYYGDGGDPLDVKGLGDGAFEGASLQKFFVPRSGQFESLGKRSFADSDLSFIDLFDSVTTIGDEAFKGSKLTELTIPASVESVGASALADCPNLEKVTFLGDTVSLGTDVFKDSPNLKQVVVPINTTAQGDLGLVNAQALRLPDEASDEDLAKATASLNLPWNVKALRVSDEAGSVEMPASLTANKPEDFEFDADTGTIQGYVGPPGVVVVPREINGVEVKIIGELAFSNLTIASVAAGTQENETLTGVILPDTIKRIEDSAFLACGTMKKFECYGAVEYLGIRSFEDCTNLKEVYFYNGLKEMGIYCFNQASSLEKADFAGLLKVLPEGAFQKCDFKEIVLDYTEVGNLALATNPNLETVRIKPSVTKIGAAAMAECPSMKAVYFERPDASILGVQEFVLPQGATGMKIILPKTATAEEQEAFVKALALNLYENGASMIVLE